MMNNVTTLFKSSTLTGPECICVCVRVVCWVSVNVLCCETGITTCQATHRERRDWEIIWIKVREVKHVFIRLSAVNHAED